MNIFILYPLTSQKIYTIITQHMIERKRLITTDVHLVLKIALLTFRKGWRNVFDEAILAALEPLEQPLRGSLLSRMVKGVRTVFGNQAQQAGTGT